MPLPYLVISRLPSIVAFTTLETAFAGFVWYQWSKPTMITGPLPSAIPKGYVGKARYQPHDLQPTHLTAAALRQPLAL